MAGKALMQPEHFTLEIIAYGRQSPPAPISRRGFADSLRYAFQHNACIYARVCYQCVNGRDMPTPVGRV
jgi:hypothetical protein